VEFSTAGWENANTFSQTKEKEEPPEDCSREKTLESRKQLKMERKGSGIPPNARSRGNALGRRVDIVEGRNVLNHDTLSVKYERQVRKVKASEKKRVVHGKESAIKVGMIREKSERREETIGTREIVGVLSEIREHLLDVKPIFCRSRPWKVSKGSRGGDVSEEVEKFSRLARKVVKLGGEASSQLEKKGQGGKKSLFHPGEFVPAIKARRGGARQSREAGRPHQAGKGNFHRR